MIPPMWIDLDTQALLAEGLTRELYLILIIQQCPAIGAPADERHVRLFAHLKDWGFSGMLLSNNKEPRVKLFMKRDTFKFYIFIKQKAKTGINYLARSMQEIGNTETTNDHFHHTELRHF